MKTSSSSLSLDDGRGWGEGDPGFCPLSSILSHGGERRTIFYITEASRLR
jgi:hypothetical protein